MLNNVVMCRKRCVRRDEGQWECQSEGVGKGRMCLFSDFGMLES